MFHLDRNGGEQGWQKSHHLPQNKPHLRVKLLSLVSVFAEESKLLHFVRFREKSLWKSPDLTPPPANQSEPLASPGKLQSSPGNGNQSAPVASRETRTNQNSTRNPSPEGDQSDPETPVFQIFHALIPYISNVTQSSGLLPIAVGIGGSPSSSLVIKTLLLLHQISAPWWSLGDFATWA